VLRSSSGTRVMVEEAMRKQKCRDGKDMERLIYDTTRFNKSSQRDRPAIAFITSVRLNAKIKLPAASAAGNLIFQKLMGS
jgi:hypothetical protein